jgi:drug/metabolite transporter (DMT)-like permease
MDIGSAVVLGLVIAGLVALARTLVEGTNPERITVLICLVIGIAAVLLVGASDFADTQIVLDKPLSELNFWSQILVGILAAGLASLTWQGVKAIRNIGDNQGTPTP